MNQDISFIDACTQLNLEINEDWKGSNGEDVAKSILGAFPIFRVVFMGEKYPVTDFYVEVVDKDTSYPFFVQVKTTTSDIDENGKLCVSVPNEKYKALCGRPIPTYVGGIDLNNDLLFIRPAFNEKEHICFIEPQMVISRKDKIDCGQKLLKMKRDVINYWENLKIKEYKQAYQSLI